MEASCPHYLSTSKILLWTKLCIKIIAYFLKLANFNLQGKLIFNFRVI